MLELAETTDTYQGDIEDTAAALAYVLGDERARFGENEYELLHKSYEVAREAHAGQRRASGEPYLSHCIETARLLCDWRLDPATVCAALLHDVIEDTGMTRDKLAEMFPAPIPELVDGVTKISQLNLKTGEDAQTESLRKLILAMSDDVRVTLIKLADRLHNMRTLQYMKAATRRRVARLTLDIYAPLAHRLGMMRVRSELEDLAMRYLWPEDYERLTEMINQKRADRDRHVHLTVEYLRKRLAEAGLEAEVSGRSKNHYSIFQKMRAQGLEFEEIYDLVAVRITCENVEACYDILGMVHQVFPPIIKRFKDYVAMPKENMYQSLHTTVIGLGGQVTEIQIRTRDMHRVAEYGVAAHWKYKAGASKSTRVDPKLLWLRRLTEWLQDVRDPNEFMSALRNEAFSDAILVFTPKGDVIELPSDSTPIDFAYAIHTDIGDQCESAKVNQRVVPLKTKLRSGDIVEIVTRKSARPSVGWLDIVKTSRARSKIRHALRSRDREQNIERGREAIQRALKSRNQNPKWDEVVHAIKDNLRPLRVHNVEELLSEVGFGAISPTTVVNRLFPSPRARKVKEEAEAARAEQVAPRARRQRPRKSTGGVIIDGMDAGVVNFAKCCRPLPGNRIVGFVTIGRGVTIHKKGCRNLAKLIDANPDSENRVLKVRWDRDNLPLLATDIRMVLSDRRGLLADISNLMAGQDVFIRSSQTHSRSDGRCVMRFSVEVRDQEQLEKLLSVLRNRPDIISITPGA